MNKLTPGHPTARHGAPTTHDATGLRPSRRALLLAWGAALGAPAFAAPGRYPITPAQRATAQGVAEAGGVPEQDLAEGAPETYTVKRGDTLWGISGLYLKQPWRWPELWGMNLADIRNPHLIYPGQVLRLQRKDGRARLATADEGPPTVRLSPRVRSERLGDTAIPTLAPHLIEPFLSEPLVVDARDLQSAPRIVATQENHVLLSRGDRAYAMGQGGIPLTTDAAEPRRFRVYRDVKPLLDPLTREVLGYEAQYVGRVRLLRGEGVSDAPGPDGKPERLPVPATLDVLDVKEEMRVGDRLLPEPERDFRHYAPHAPADEVDARVVSIYGSAVRFAAQNQIVVINKGTRDGIEVGDVLAILKAGARVVDKTDGQNQLLRLPDERNGLLMVFRPFERVSYGLVLEITDGVKVGDRLVNPR